MEKNIKMIVATHKKYEMPKDLMYVPLQVGADGKEKITDYEQDNIGDNISSKNPYFCELTGLYWAWKNLDADYIGLSHYRRHFSLSKKLPKEVNERIEKDLNYKEVSKEAIFNNGKVAHQTELNFCADPHFAHLRRQDYNSPGINRIDRYVERKINYISSDNNSVESAEDSKEPFVRASNEKPNC